MKADKVYRDVSIKKRSLAPSVRNSLFRFLMDTSCTYLASNTVKLDKNDADHLLNKIPKYNVKAQGRNTQPVTKLWEH
ncbi:hypothetical protein THF5H11_20715 [Vibrio jasicida]|nr:hypothetical protein THF5H11_20715 [Vibrio jasicida]CAH1606863.1 hypothetical protein THF5G08_30315 [Vibrio jasicida]